MILLFVFHVVDTYKVAVDMKNIVKISIQVYLANTSSPSDSLKEVSQGVTPSWEHSSTELQVERASQLG